MPMELSCCDVVCSSMRETGLTPELSPNWNAGARWRRFAVYTAFQIAAMVFCTDAHAADVTEFESMSAKAQSALADNHYKQALAEFRVLEEISPDFPEVLLGLARSELGLGHPKAALALYARVIHQGLGSSLPSDAGFMSLDKQGGFAELFAEAKSESAPIVNAKVAFTLDDRTLIPEGIAYDEVNQRFFVSSTYRRKIVERMSDGKNEDFVHTADHGLWQALGLKIDARRGWLVVCSGADSANMVGFETTDLGKSAVFIYDLNSAHVIARYDVPTSGKHLFNDLVIGLHDDIYITDSVEGSVYKLDLRAHRLQRLTPIGQFIYPNGITMSPDGGTLYVADEAVGIDLLDPNTGAVRRLPHAQDVTTVGIDGLYFHDGYLIATQTDTHPNRVMAFRLSSSLNAITGSTLLERGDPLMGSPTEGVVVGDHLYFLANSQQNDFDQSGHIFTEDRLVQTNILTLAIPDK